MVPGCGLVLSARQTVQTGLICWGYLQRLMVRYSSTLKVTGSACA